MQPAGGSLKWEVKAAIEQFKGHKTKDGVSEIPEIPTYRGACAHAQLKERRPTDFLSVYFFSMLTETCYHASWAAIYDF